ncbi:hypothetical protein RhiirA1_480686 [Rhizophagus irregularis]|uniref:Uncharacterized protein n=1 Tax=Rhizophagus irregularis TaxID=588596 RepID=A0A2N0QP03_9GLOM|nr:hypothetical protein RhiirA1_480686 [Rhizophagus irregularis]
MNIMKYMNNKRTFINSDIIAPVVTSFLEVMYVFDVVVSWENRDFKRHFFY